MAMSALRRRVVGNPLARTVLSIWSWLWFGVLLILVLPVVALVRLVTAPFDRGRYYPGLVFRRSAVLHVKANPLWSFRTSGEHVVDPRKPYVVVANHESFVDMLLISQLPWEMKWLSKEDFFRYPVMGQVMRMIGDIKMVRGNKDSVMAAMDSCKERLRNRVSVMIFPEGTRSRDSVLQPFKDGAFRLAIETGTPILPLAATGTRDALVKGDWRFGVAEGEVRVLPVIETAGLTLDDVPRVRDQARNAIAAALAAMRAASNR
jgi:1-acyl-sn-glycerol-3-phosphate acyltransferase